MAKRQSDCELSAALDDYSPTLRDYQVRCVEDAAAFTGRRRLYASPCGSGKGTMQLVVRQRMADKHPIILTPSLEIVRGFFSRCGVDVSDLSETKLRELAESARIYTPVTARNRYLEGELAAPSLVLCDEAHHATEREATVTGDLFAMWPEARFLGWTATPFRGTPKETAKLREAWGEPVVLATLPGMIEAGHVMLPRFSVAPICDDDSVRLKGGQFQVGGAKGSGRLVEDRAEGIADLVLERCVDLHDVDRVVRVPTVVVTPSRAAAGRVAEELDALGIGWRLVLGTTKARDRAEAYSLCEQRRVVLVTVNVLAEGFDMPALGCLVDASPTLSPVAWLQRIGRVMRPKPARPDVIVCCRNLERWSFLLLGALPNDVIREAQKAFEAPSKRVGMRSIGFERLSRFKALRLPMVDGAEGYAYHLSAADEDGRVTEYSILQSPYREDPLCASRTNGVKPDGRRDYGTWRACPVPLDLAGFATSKWTGDVTPKQRAWWERAARSVGLDPGAADEITQREFAALPMLLQSKQRLYA